MSQKSKALQALAQERAAARARVPADAAKLWARAGRIGVVLSGGGARGAYEAGALLAMSDAQLPTHILAATSIGSINAASYAAHSDSLVGNAEPLVDSWCELTPQTVGIDWFRYILVLAGLVLSAGSFASLLKTWALQRGVYLHMQWPKLTWLAGGLLGACILLFQDDLAYLAFVIKTAFGERKWRPDKQKALRSMVANLAVWGGAAAFFILAHVHLSATDVLDWTSRKTLLVAGALLTSAAALLYSQREKVSLFSHEFLRLPLRSGLFPNFERTRYLRERIPEVGIRLSPIRVVMTAADIESGADRYFSNSTRDELLRDTGVDPRFVLQEVETPQDLMLAVVASSAFPLVYETVPLAGHKWTDGGIVANQPIRPAIRLGAELLLLVMVEPRSQVHQETKTFLDVGVRALDILMAQNLKTDLKILSSVNALCEHFARESGLHPEQVELDIGTRRYRHLKSFTIEPTEPLEATVLDFDGEITAPAILAGYRDCARELQSLAEYLRGLPEPAPRRLLKLRAEALSSAASASASIQ